MIGSLFARNPKFWYQQDTKAQSLFLETTLPITSTSEVTAFLVKLSPDCVWKAGHCRSNGRSGLLKDVRSSVIVKRPCAALYRNRTCNQLRSLLINISVHCIEFGLSCLLLHK